MWKQFQKVHWSKNQFWELSLDDLEEWFKWNETLALSYLNPKFEEVTEDIKERIRIQLLTDWEEVFYLWWTFY